MALNMKIHNEVHVIVKTLTHNTFFKTNFMYATQ